MKIRDETKSNCINTIKIGSEVCCMTMDSAILIKRWGTKIAKGCSPLLFFYFSQYKR